MQQSKSVQEYQSEDDDSDVWEWACTYGSDCNCNFCMSDDD